MYKPSSITDFFKPFAQPSRNKRPLPNDDSQRSRAVRPPPGLNSQPSKGKIKQQGKKATVPERGRRIRSPNTLEDAPNVQHAQFDGATDEVTLAEAFPSTNSLDILGSQGPVLTSSQRVVKNGEVMIRNSEDEASDSDSSLADIDHLLASKKVAEKSSSPTEPELPLLQVDNKTSPDGSRTRRKARRTAIADNPRRPPTRPVIPKYKFSLESLVKQNKKYEESETQTAKARMLLRSLEQTKDNATDGGTRIPDKGPKVNEELVASVMQQLGESEDVGRLMTAIERTEALYQGKSWSFFEGSEEVPEPKEDGFPPIDRLNGILGG